MANDYDVHINDLRIAVKRMKAWFESNSIGEVDLVKNKNRFEDLADKLEKDIRIAVPAILLAFDDRGGKPSIICSPSIHVKFGDELERMAWIGEKEIDMPEVSGTLGPRTTALCRNFFHLSEVVREMGYEGLTALREIKDEDIDVICAPFLPETRDEPEFV